MFTVWAYNTGIFAFQAVVVLLVLAFGVPLAFAAFLLTIVAFLTLFPAMLEHAGSEFAAAIPMFFFSAVAGLIAADPISAALAFTYISWLSTANPNDVTVVFGLISASLGLIAASLTASAIKTEAEIDCDRSTADEPFLNLLIAALPLGVGTIFGGLVLINRWRGNRTK